MKKILTPAQRVIVAADFEPEEGVMGYGNAEDQVVGLLKKLKGTGVCIKVNDSLRACGYRLIDVIHDYGFEVFADLKLYDISRTLIRDGKRLREAKADMLTVSCVSGFVGMTMLAAELPDTEILGVTVLTSQGDDDSGLLFGGDLDTAVMRLGGLAVNAGLDGVVASGREAFRLRSLFKDFNLDASINVGAIRPAWALVDNDDQHPDRMMTPAQAIEAGADRVIIGRPIIEAQEPHNAVRRTIDEIAKAVDSIAMRK